MSVSGADIAKGINALWNSSDLDDQFTAFWTATEIANNPVLNDDEATPGNAFPYCVFKVDPGTTITRMSAGEGLKQQIRTVPLIFHVFAKQNSGTSAKQIAANMAEEILKIYGGHPEVNPTDMSLDHGNFLITQLVNDYGVRVEDSVYQWIINYNIMVDVPVAI